MMQPDLSDLNTMPALSRRRFLASLIAAGAAAKVAPFADLAEPAAVPLAPGEYHTVLLEVVDTEGALDLTLKLLASGKTVRSKMRYDSPPAFPVSEAIKAS